MLAIALAGALISGSQSAPADEGQEVLRAVIAIQARNYGAGFTGIRPCVSATTTPQHVRGRSHPGHPARANPYSWYHLVGRRDGRGERVPATEEARIQVAERAAWAVPAEPRSIERINASWLPATFQFCTGTGYQVPLEFSAPVIIGDLAFVSVDYQCIMCGRGMLLALERRSTDWALLAWTEQWIS